MKGFINFQNKTNERFRQCLGRYLNLVNKSPAKIRNVNNEFKNQFNVKVKNFMFMKKAMQKQKNKIIFPLIYLIIFFFYSGFL